MKISLHYTRNNRRRRHRCSAHLMLAQLRCRRARGRATSAMAAAVALIIQEMEEKEADSPARLFIPSLSTAFLSNTILPRSDPSFRALRSRWKKRDRPSHCQNAAAVAGYAFGFSDGKLNGELDR